MKLILEDDRLLLRVHPDIFLPFLSLPAMGVSPWTRGRAVGRGSSATVFLAKAHSSGEVFAVKSAELPNSEPLQREAEILSWISHPRVVSEKGSGVTRENGRELFNLFMEFFPEGSLADAIRRRGGRLEEDEIRGRAREIVEGVAHLHSSGVVHCDIKGSNVLISKGEAKIGDLGCARLAGGAGGTFSGTPLFMAPEVARGEEQGFAADIWAVGCTVIEMATGSPPWGATSDASSVLYRIACSGQVPEFPVWLSETAKDFLGKCLRRDPDERWTAEQLLKHPFLAGENGSHRKLFLDSPLENSPKSTLDFGVWDTLDDAAGGRATTDVEFPANSPAERVQRLAGGRTMVTRPDWTLDENWVTVRGVERSQAAVAEHTSGPVSSQGGGEDRALDFATSLEIEERNCSSDSASSSGFNEETSVDFGFREEIRSAKDLNRRGEGQNFPMSADPFRRCWWKGINNYCKFESEDVSLCCSYDLRT